MESSSSTTRFKFRDHQDMDATVLSDASSDISSVSSDPADIIGGDDDDGEEECDLQSMTATGIKHLCSELLELKAASDEEFHRNLFSNYSAFIRIFEEVEGTENELMKLKNHVSNQKKLVKELVDGIYPKLLAEEAVESVSEDSESDEILPSRKLEAHIKYVSETLDTLLSENRVAEALDILEMEEENLDTLKYKKGTSVDDLKFYISVISEGKSELMLKLRLIAGNPRTAAAELQQALSRLYRLGDSQLATSLLLEYYHSRIETGVDRLRNSQSFPSAVYIRELSKFVFSMISQAARSFVMLHRETSPCASELVQWAHKETEDFATHFVVYISSISEISGGLSTMVQSLQFAVSFCSLLEAQNLVLRQYLIKQVHPGVEEVLEIYIDHFKNVVVIFTATDSWVLGKYLMSGILGERFIGNQPEYCLLTSSGRKLLTLLQAISRDVSPLAALEMESSTIKCLTDLFMEYISTIENFINGETGHPGREKDDCRFVSMETLMKQISMLMNLSTLEHLFSGITRSILDCKGQMDCSDMDEHSVLDNSFSSIQEALGRVKSCFHWQHISRIMSTQDHHRISSEASSYGPSNSVVPHDVKPSIPLQVLFLELRKINRLVEDVVEISWMMELLGDMVEAAFDWSLDNKVISASREEEMDQHSDPAQEQFILDVQFLIEIAVRGGYVAYNLEKLRESAFLSAGLDPKRVGDEDGWIITAAGEAIEKLLQIEEEEISESEPDASVEEETEPCVSSVEDCIGSEECAGGRDAASAATTADVPDAPGTEADSDCPGEGKSSRMQGPEFLNSELTDEAVVEDQSENEAPNK